MDSKQTFGKPVTGQGNATRLFPTADGNAYIRQGAGVEIHSRRAVDGLTSSSVGVVRFHRVNEYERFTVQQSQYSRYDGEESFDRLVGWFATIEQAEQFASQLWSV